MIRFSWYRSGSLFGIGYEMSYGDQIREHCHDERTLHNVIVLAGDIEIRTPEVTLHGHPGDVLDFDGTEKHSIHCVSQKAKILNILLNGIPPGYAELPKSEHSGIYL